MGDGWITVREKSMGREDAGNPKVRKEFPEQAGDGPSGVRGPDLPPLFMSPSQPRFQHANPSLLPTRIPNRAPSDYTWHTGPLAVRSAMCSTGLEEPWQPNH